MADHDPPEKSAGHDFALSDVVTEPVARISICCWSFRVRQVLKGAPNMRTSEVELRPA